MSRFAQHMYATRDIIHGCSTPVDVYAVGSAMLHLDYTIYLIFHLFSFINTLRKNKVYPALGLIKNYKASPYPVTRFLHLEKSELFYFTA